MNEKARLKEIVSILKESNFIGGITPEKVCKTITKLGPTFIKIGQIMASRYDVLPKEYCDELSKLRSNVEPMPFSEVHKILEEELGNVEEIFENISEKSIGSASMAQVHKAKLKTGEIVAVKVQRRNIYETMTMDVKLLKRAIILLHLRLIVKSIDLTSVIDEIYNVAKEEMNFEIEAKHLEEFRENNIDITYVEVPKIYKNFITKKVLVMDYIEGISLNEKEQLEKAGYDVVEIGEKLANNYIKQALDDGFFHADPHPDNILIEKNNIVYIDLGMMGRLTEKNKMLLKKCIKAIVVNDYKEVSKILVNMSTKTSEIDYMVLENDVAAILEEFGNLDLESISTTKFVSDMFTMLRKNHLVLDQDVTMLIRGIATIEPVIKELNPKISLLKVLSTSQTLNIKELLDINNIRDKSRKVINNVDKMIDIPGELSSLLKSINNGETKFKLELSDSTKQVDKIENLVHELIIGFIDGCLIISSVLINDLELRKIFIMCAIVLSSWLLIKMIFDLIHRGY